MTHARTVTRHNARQAARAASGKPTGLVITADDFGLDTAVNDAVEQAHTHGVLNATSLMVSAPAAEDAVARARRLPRLAVGLHLVLADGKATLPPPKIPDLVGPDGRFGDHMARDGVRFFLLTHVRRQLAAEIRAQFEAFAATGLELDHVNAHKHFHVHPTVLSLLMSIGREFGMQAVRLPAEPDMAWWLAPWMGLMRARLDRAGLAHNDHIFGISETGAMDEPALLKALSRLPGGVTEIYSHPATRRGLTPAMSGYRHTDELAALTSPRVRDAIGGLGLVPGGFSSLT
ncbi:MAG: hopanoid biosynthesis-associated protein HpnK [Xanthomonadaceae bacterium]|nr:hopanoid biosynthesis-associated protein HpnK [Xanthomonadaceae bacterium]